MVGKGLKGNFSQNFLMFVYIQYDLMSSICIDSCKRLPCFTNELAKVAIILVIRHFVKITSGCGRGYAMTQMGGAVCHVQCVEVCCFESLSLDNHYGKELHYCWL